MFPTRLSLILASGSIPLIAYCQVYLSEEQMVKESFPGEVFTRRTIILSPEETRRIEERSGERVRNTSLIAWVGAGKRVIFVDQVLGKHEFITYAVAVDTSRKIKAVDILEYRETYGQGVKQPEWRKQFAGTDATSPLRLNKEIVNISGATLSSSHITGGVRRLLQTYEVVRARL